MVVHRTHRIYRFIQSRKFFIFIVWLYVFAKLYYTAQFIQPAQLIQPAMMMDSIQTILLNARSKPSMSQCNYNTSRQDFQEKVVSFSLFAKEYRMEVVLKRYMPGIKENLRKIREFYPGWSIRIYTNISDTDQRFFQNISFGKDLFICNIDDLPYLGDMSGLKNGMFWRFLPMYDPTVDIFISRDLDSVVNARERAAVKQWEESDKVFHAMRDHPKHINVVLGGMWGAKNYMFNVNITKPLDFFSKVMFSDATNDQGALDIGLYSPLKSLFMVHDSYLCEKEKFKPSIPFPNKREDPKQYVGKVLYGGKVRKPPKNVYVCPVACRPDYGKDWIYC